MLCRNSLFFLLMFSLGVLSAAASAQRMSRDDAVTEVGQNIPDKEMISRLRKGGLVVLFRHGYTDHDQNDSRSRDYTDCSIQRNLDAKGRRESKETGAAFNKLGIPVGGIYVSPKCRTRDTALEAFGRAENLNFLFINHAGAKDQRRAFLGTIPKDSKNVVAVSHGSRIKAMVWFERGSSGPWSGQIQEGDAIVLEPLGDSKFKFLAKVEPEDWLRLQKKFVGK